jgi:phosphoribosyl-ATP pyrophosphohydrolase/phosphoribosyl-AMP cyclohydrolase
MGERMTVELTVDEQISFDERGLVPAVVQDAATDEVLMVAWMNREALRLTQGTGQVHFWSRSRRELWHKGATSGNSMNVREILVDCDADTLLVKVDPEGPACHTGERSCFYRTLMGERSEGSRADAGDILEELFEVIIDRRRDRPPGSYTAELFDAGEDEILKKIGEEAMEVVLAAKGQGDERLIAETADLTYHLLVLLAARGLTLTDVERELAKRRG